MKPLTSTNAKPAAAFALALLGANAAFLTSGQTGLEGNLPQPKLVIMDKSLAADQSQKAVQAARLFYAFWNTGDPQFAKLALATNFTDRTLPKGRPQGVDGPLFASSNFRQAVPDLRCDVEQLIVAGDRVVAHLHFWGHFTGAFGQKQGAGQAVDFIATDILRVQDGRITDNWHIEDNLMLMQQLGVVQL
jgi:predicted ester cyclase